MAVLSWSWMIRGGKKIVNSEKTSFCPILTICQALVLNTKWLCIVLFVNVFWMSDDLFDENPMLLHIATELLAWIMFDDQDHWQI